MTSIRYEKAEGQLSLAIEGHAGYDQEGKDIVCAGISAIAYTLIGWLDHNGGHYEVESGYVYAASPRTKEMEIAFDVTALGLEQIAHKYPQYVDYHRAAQGG